MSLLNWTLEADIPGDVMWSLIDGKHIVSFYKSSLDSVYRQHEDTMVIRVEGSRNLLSGEDLQWVSRVCCLLCVGR